MNYELDNIFFALESAGYVSGGYDYDKEAIAICKRVDVTVEDSDDGYKIVGWVIPVNERS